MDTLLKPFLDFIASFRQFISEDIWNQDFTKLSRLRAFAYRQLQIIYLVARAFFQDRLLVRASALVYATLLSIVPLLAVMFSLLKGFGFTNRLEPFLNQLLDPLGEQAKNIIVPNIVHFVENVNVGALGAAGFLILLVSVLSIINNIERAFNDIWKVKRTRSLQRRFSDYLSVLIIGPVLIIAVLGVTASLQSNSFVQAITHNTLIRVFFNKTAPFVATWIAFYFLFTFVPNTKVQISSAFIGALISGSLWQVSNWFFAHFIVSSYQTGTKAAIYAGFATLPLFLVWLFISWAVVLLGSEISYAHQNVGKISWEEKAAEYSQHFLESIALKILLFCGEKYYRGETAPTSNDIADKFNIPERVVNQVITKLLSTRLLLLLDEESSRYVPGQSIETLKVKDVLHRLRNSGLDNIDSKTDEDHISTAVARVQSEMDKTLAQKFGEMSLKDLLFASNAKTTISG